MKHHLYGLDVKLNISKFYITDLKTDRELEFGNFRISLRKGNFRFPIPFGLIMKKSKKNFIIICKILEPEMYGQL